MKRQGAVLGIGIGGALLGPVIGSAAELSEPRLVFGVVALLILVLTGCALATPGPIDLERALSRGALRTVGRDRRLLGGMWFTALAAALFGVLNVLTPLRLSALGAGAVAIGAVFLLSAAIEGAASPLFGRLSDRRGPPPLIRAGLAGSALLALLLPLSDAAWLLGLATVLAGFTFGMPWVPASALLSVGVEAGGLHQSLAWALWNFSWAIGFALGSAVGAPLAQVSGDASPTCSRSALSRHTDRHTRSGRHAPRAALGALSGWFAIRERRASQAAYRDRSRALSRRRRASGSGPERAR